MPELPTASKFPHFLVSPPKTLFTAYSFRFQFCDSTLSSSSTSTPTASSLLPPSTSILSTNKALCQLLSSSALTTPQNKQKASPSFFRALISRVAFESSQALFPRHLLPTNKQLLASLTTHNRQNGFQDSLRRPRRRRPLHCHRRQLHQLPQHDHRP